MRIHWYWPYAHRKAESQTISASAAPGDQVTVQALSTRFGDVISGETAYRMVRDLPESNSTPVPNRLRRGPNRARIYVKRAVARHRLATSGQFDVSCQHHLNHYVDWLALRRLGKRVPVVSFVHDVEPHEPRLPARVESALQRATYRSAGQIIVFHEELGARLHRDFDVAEERIHVIPHPIQQRSTTPPRPADKCRILMFGTMRNNKGIGDLLKSLHFLERDDFELHLAGRADGQAAQEIKTAAQRFPGVVSHELGYIENDRKQELFSSADLVVLPYSRFASQSGVLADAYAHARGLVVTDVGALGATVRADRTGLVARPADPRSIAECLGRAIADPMLRNDWSAAAAKAATRHAPETVGAEIRSAMEIAMERFTATGGRRRAFP